MHTINDLAGQFAVPPNDYAPVPFWFLNAGMDPEELERQLRLMEAIGIGTVVLHSRQGRTVEYLSEAFMQGILHCVEVCASLGMKAWLYDEDNWPSGYGGGLVLEGYPRGQAKCLAMVPGAEASEGVVHRSEGLAFVQQLTPWHPAYSAGWYTDLLDPRVTEVFLAGTHERYAQVLGKHLGSTVTAVFTDEPGFYNHFYDCAPGTVIWTPDLPQQFEARCRYDLLPRLKGLFQEASGAEELRRDFYRVVGELLVERFYLPMKRWCEQRGMMLVGHVNNEEYLIDHVRYNADFFSAMDGLSVPGIDVIAPQGNYRRAPDSLAPKLASSAAHTRGKSMVISETYGATGWELSPEDWRRMADWQSVRGVTRLVPHALYYSIEGERYHESPPSLFYQSPHWPYMPALVQYLSRWTWLLENTEPAAKVALYYPIDAVRAATTPQVQASQPAGLDETTAEPAVALGVAFRELADALFRAHIDFDIVDDTALARAEVLLRCLAIGGRCYEALVLPPGEPADASFAVIARVEQMGVAVLRGEVAAVVEQAGRWATVRLEPESSQVTIARREAQDGSLFLVVNEGEENYEGTLSLPAVGELTHWDWGAGQVDRWPCEVVGEETRVRLRLLAGASACFCLAREG